ncbi:uncharacterized protein [Haliotis asinina]|uniref:uncharacterized protein n=1 Tax=Haliotis asinina TaxID=109174 RepID=UPI003531A8D8
MDLLCAAIGYLAVCISISGTHAASYKARYLMYSTTAVSWNTAQATCSLLRGHLITVDNNVTINVLKYIRAQPEAAAVSDNIWIGLYNAVPTSHVPVYVWTDCKHTDENTTIWFPGEPNSVQTDHCIITSPEYEWKTRNCNEKHAFFCERATGVDCTFEKETGQNCEMGGVRLSEKMTEDACATRCQEEMDGSDICWAYEYNTLYNQCNLLFGSDPYMCETLQRNVAFTTGRRRCFKFSDVTGSEVASTGDLFPDCITTEVSTSKEIAASFSTTSSTTVEATMHTSTMTSSTPSRTVMTFTLETTATTTTTTSRVTTTSTTPSTTLMISTLETAATTTTTIQKTTSAVTTSTTPNTRIMMSTLETTIAAAVTTTTTTIPTTTSSVTTLNPTSRPDTTTDTTVAPINSETSPTATTTQNANTMAETTLETTSDNAITSSVTPFVTTTTASSPAAVITTTITTTATTDTDSPTSTLATSTASTAASSSNATGIFSPSIDTFLLRLQAALASSSTLTSPGRYVYEVCVVVKTFTIAERKKRTDDMVSDLTLDKKNLSSYRRKKSSAEDERPSAQGVGGGVAIILLVTTALIIILPDCASILMHVVHVLKKKQRVP